MLRNEKLYNKVIALRKKGLSYNEILGLVHVGYGTLSRWCCSIELTEKQKNRINDKKRNTPLIKNSINLSLINKEKDMFWAQKAIREIVINDYDLLLSGAMLYWAEGFNSNKSQNAVFTNTDPEMIRLMMRFFREILLVKDYKIKIMVRIGEKGDAVKAKFFWSMVTGLKKDNFQKLEILKLKENSKSLERNPYGMCRLSIYDVTVRRKISNCVKLIKEKISPRSSMDRA